ncbi:uncharacterized protein LOC118464824 isoform X2 [Anopheles albimanus]|uniref:uncharacterized protein LOC118464824 isoform X2 n=1 Tax=Anopheles albimanus TaxID=7167 RepID=UPI00163E270F|nr:uncharacterized protein LOC118464824 isoform X2 [Anopheles albimanus]
MMIDNYECAGYTFYSKFDSGNLGKVELVRCAEGLGIVGNTVSSVPIGIGTVAGSGSSNVASISGVPIIGSAGTSGGSGVVSNSTIAATTSTSASAIVAATLGVGLHQQHGASGSSASTAGLGLPIPSPTPHATENPLVEIEFNLWTRPDCAGTPYENQNRTWFHFAVTGGRPNQIVKFNVMNLNKQAKLFSQGMHPVTKVGPNGRWERIKDKPSYSITNDVFYISFLHKAPEVGSEQTKIYYAFTFPFTYTELLDQLATFDRKFGRHPFELNKMAYEISQKYDTSSVPAGTTTSTTPTPGDGTKQSSSRRKGKLAKMERVDRTSPESFDETARDGTAIGPPKPSADASESAPPDPTGTAQQKAAKREPSGMVIDENTSESMQQITNLVNKVKIELPQGAGPVASSSSSLSTSSSSKLKLPSFHQQLSSTSNSSVNVVASTSTTGTTTDDDSKGSDQRDEIYYCRELLTHSVEHRRIELLTISSFHGIQTAREPRLRNLFPDEQAQRCHTFRDKKIVFISSRVHPGETPASFVLNGFLSMLLDRKSIVSQTLRRMYVFKVIPFLNPDGVYNGLYRSDTRGHNLNRVYLGPCHETQPAIYAARKLIRYYHLGTDEVEPYELEQEKKSSSPESIHPPAVGVPPNIVNQGESGAAEGTEESTSAVASSTPPTSVGTNAAVAAKKESDSIEQDTPPASDSGFSEASTSSKVVTMSSISSAGSPVGEPEEGAQQEQTDTTVSVATTDATLSTTNNTTTTTVANPTLAPTKAFTEKLIPELHPIVSEAPPVASVRPAIAARSSSSLSIVSTGSKKSVQAKVDSGKGGKGGFHKQHHSLNKPQFIGVTPTGGGTLKLKDCIIHHHHHHHHHHHALHHHHHHTGASAAAIGSVSGGGGTAGPKLALGSFKKAASKQQQSGQSAATSSCCSSIIGTGAVGGAGVRTATGERGILGETMGGKSRPQTPQTQPSVTIPSATSSLLYGASGSHYRSHRNEYLNPGGGPQRQLNISLDFLTQQLDERSERMVFEDRSNLFMYLDLHGHASKKGVFMYGNHLPSTAEAVECMLLPRLMSLNSQHFHFDACNFSERNMYYKGKRDGLSKEGSGRVAVYKCTGLIKSYTLECNYNTGKCVNILPARGKEIVAKATHTLVPPKYTPGVFEEVGRALGPSILDLTNSNPLSRLPNCEFRTLQGLRNALRIEIERGSSKARVTNKCGDIISYDWL